MTEARVTVAGASRTYGSTRAVDHADLVLSRGRILGLLGASGSGKSTLLRMICGLERVDAGTISIDGEVVSGKNRSLPPEKRRVGMVFQDFALFPHLTVAQNIGFGLKGRSDQKAVVQMLLERMRLSDRAVAFPHMLSGGEQQRVALARALARDPAVILLDEPFSSLDGSLRTEVRDDLVQALRESGTSAIIVTHDAEDAMVMADDLALMDKGRIIQTGTPVELYTRPTSLAAAKLLGAVNLLEAQVRNGRAISAIGETATPLEDGPAWIGVRPTDLVLEETGSGIAVRIVSTGYSGAYKALRVSCQSQTLMVHVRGNTPPNGTEAKISVEPERLLVFPRNQP